MNKIQYLKFNQQEGSIVQVTISPDERTIAACTAKGIVLIFENCFVDPYVKPQVYFEHKGNVITASKWQENSLYCGDNTGKVSVIIVKKSLVKIFQL